MNHAQREPIDVEYEIIDEGNPSPRGMGRNGYTSDKRRAGMDGLREGISAALAALAELLSEGARGRAMVEGLNVAGLTYDPDRARQVYLRHKAAIDELAGEINVRQLIDMITGAGLDVSREQASGAMIGFVVGALGGSAVQRYLDRTDSSS